VQFGVTVTRDGTLFRASEPLFESSDSSVVRILDATTGVALFESTGLATVAVSFQAAEFPDSMLQAAMVVAVDSLSVSISLESAIVTAGDTLVGDTVLINATVTRKDGRKVGTLAQFVSSDTDVLQFMDANSGIAELTGPGEAEVTVTFLLPVVPGEPLTAVIPVNVTDFSLQFSVASLSSGSIETGDTLVTDSVQFSVSAQKGGVPIAIVDPSFSSSNPDIITILDPATGRAVFADTGTAVVSVDFSEPNLPKANANVPLRVTTYLVDLRGPSSPVMGDEVDYRADVIDTRSGEAISSSGRRFTSTNTSVIQILDNKKGDAFVRDVGTTNIRATFDKPKLPYASLSRTLSVNVNEERFYGPTSEDNGDFGDDVRLDASDVHRFTPSTWVEFPNGTIGWVDNVTSTRLEFRVPAGANSGRLRLHNLVDDNGAPRNNVLTHWTFDSDGTVTDDFEPNDRFPLNNGLRIRSLPWERFLSSDPQKAAPADTNFFWFRTGFAATFDFSAEWQQDADLDFKLCLAVGQPPVDYLRASNGQPICARGPGDNSNDRSSEQGLNLRLEQGTWILAFYCVDCPNVPLTYQGRFVWTGF
jgi:hypothetical protein